jgi:hypothetical protein
VPKSNLSRGLDARRLVSYRPSRAERLARRRTLPLSNVSQGLVAESGNDRYRPVGQSGETMRRRWVVLFLLLVVGAIGGGVYSARSESDTDTAATRKSTTASPPKATPPVASQAPLPEGTPTAVRAYLEGEGRLILEFRSVSAGLLDLPGVADLEARHSICSRIAGELDARVNPSDLLRAASNIPDASLAESAINDRTARSEALVSCGERNREATDSALRAVAAIDTLFEQRLKEVG